MPDRDDGSAMSQRRKGTRPWTVIVLAVLALFGFSGVAAAAGLVGVRAAAQRDALLPIIAVTGTNVEGNADAAKLSFDLSGPVEAKAFVMADPDRVVVDLPQVEFILDAKTGHGASGRHARKTLIGSFRFGLLAPGRSRVVIDLAAPVRIVAAEVKLVDGRPKLVVALARTDRAAFLAAARTPAPAPVAAAAVISAVPGKPTVVIDPGHGGPDNGAMVGGVVEKDVTLAFAKQLAGKLEAGGRFNVVMSRASDVFVPLSERVRIARSAGAALMISVHADTLPESTDVSGATVYTVSDKASDAYAAKVAAKENEADRSVGVDGQADVADVNDILFDLTRQETRAYSHVFARTLVNYWKVAGRLNKNPQRAAGFVVLKAPDVPSVLLELGYLSSPQDSAQLTSDSWRDAATGRMAEAIQAYFADQHGPAKAAAGVPIPAKQAFAALPDGK